MQWTILNVSIPVHDLNKSKEFYEMILGSKKMKEIYTNLYLKMKKMFFLESKALV